MLLAWVLAPVCWAGRFKIKTRFRPTVRTSRSSLQRRGLTEAQATRVLRNRQQAATRSFVSESRAAGHAAPTRQQLMRQGLTGPQADRVLRKRMEAAQRQAHASTKATPPAETPPLTKAELRAAQKRAKQERQRARLLARGEGAQTTKPRPAGVTPRKRRVEEVDPRDLNFSQTSVNKRFDTPEGKVSIASAARKGPEQVRDFPPLKVHEVKGQLVVRDGNSRLWVARQAKAKKIKVEREDGELIGWQDLNKRLKNNGLGNQGTSTLPTPR